MKHIPAWLIVFSAPMLALHAFALVAIGPWAAVALWLFSGFVIGFIVCIEEPMPLRERLKITLLWLPLLWREI